MLSCERRFTKMTATDQTDQHYAEKYRKLVQLIGEYHYNLTGIDEPMSPEDRLRHLHEMAGGQDVR